MWLLHIAGETPPVVIATPTPVEVAKQEAPPAADQPSVPKKKVQPLPPEFRTSLKQAETKKETKPFKPPPRGEDLPPLQILLAETSVGINAEVKWNFLHGV